MKRLFLIAVLMGLAFGAQAQTATNLNLRCIVSLSDGSRTTNVLNISGVRLAGLIESWKQDTTNKTKAKVPELTLGQYVVQELRDKGAEWEQKGALAEMKTAGFTNTAVTPNPRFLERWSGLSAADQAKAVDYLNRIEQ